jgi:hypothetical protein
VAGIHEQPSYKTRSWLADNEPLKRHGKLSIASDRETSYDAAPTRRGVVQQATSDIAI